MAQPDFPAMSGPGMSLSIVRRSIVGVRHQAENASYIRMIEG